MSNEKFQGTMKLPYLIKSYTLSTFSEKRVHLRLHIGSQLKNDLKRAFSTAERKIAYLHNIALAFSWNTDQKHGSGSVYLLYNDTVTPDMKVNLLRFTGCHVVHVQYTPFHTTIEVRFLKILVHS